MATPHISAEKGQIAKTVIMSGDPLRAKFIAEKYLNDYKLVNEVRGMLAYTGFYKGKEITVMGHGMGMAGAGIYFYELFKFYDVEQIIRLGSCGTTLENVKLLDVLLVDKVYTESNYAYIFSKKNKNIEQPDSELTKTLQKTAIEKNIEVHRGTVMTCDVFDPYVDWQAIMNRVPKDLEVLGTEMECFALFHIANELGKKSACLLTVVDSKCTKDIVSSEDRELSLISMIEIALDSI